MTGVEAVLCGAARNLRARGQSARRTDHRAHSRQRQLALRSRAQYSRRRALGLPATRHAGATAGRNTVGAGRRTDRQQTRRDDRRTALLGRESFDAARRVRFDSFFSSPNNPIGVTVETDVADDRTIIAPTCPA